MVYLCSTKYIYGLICVVLAFISSFPCAALTVSEEADVISVADLNESTPYQYVPDGTLSLIDSDGKQRWIMPLWDKKNGGITHYLSEGTNINPIRTKIWIKKRSHLFTNVQVQDGSLWITNTYQTASGILAFLHQETVDGSGRPGSTGKTRIGLAWSDNGGETFNYLGPIISAFGDPDPHNVQGGMYIVRNGYFYLYYHDVRGITVARAPVNEVITAAAAGKASMWTKYMGVAAGFLSKGLGGDSVPIGLKGASHNDAVCSTYNDRCYLILTMMTWGGGKSSIILYESLDGVRWRIVKTIAEIPPSDGVRGYHYAAIVDASGNMARSGLVGREFYVYSTKNFLDQDGKIVRWHVDIGE